MKKNLRKITAVLTAAMVLTVLTGCSKGSQDGGDTNNSGNTSNSENSSGGKGSTLQVSLDHSYSSEKVTIDGIGEAGDFYKIGDNFLISSYDSTTYEEELFLYYPADGTSKPFKFNYPQTIPQNEEAWNMSGFPTADNNFCVIYSHSRNSQDENGDYTYENLGYVMETYDMEMNLLETKELDISDDMNFGNVYPAPDGNYYVTIWDNNTGAQTVGIFDKDFQQVGTLGGSMNYLQGIYTLADGSACACYQDDSWNMVMGKIDPATNEITPIEIEGMPAWFNQCFASTDSNYDIYVSDSTSIYGVSLANGKVEEVVNWINSDFIGNYIGNVCQLSDGKFMISSNNADYTHSDMWKLSPRDPSELENVKLLSLSTFYPDDNVLQAVNVFNRSNDEYRIAIYDYSKLLDNTGENYEEILKKFKDDMTSGIVADIICTDSVPYESLASKGIFADLTDRVNALDTNKYFTNAINTLKYGDKLYRMGFSFQLMTVEGKTELVGDKQGKTVSEYLDMIQNLPEGVNAFTSDMTKMYALNQLAASNLNAFVDVTNHTCTFNSPEFVRLLEFCNTYPDETNQNMDDRSEEEWEKYWAEESYQYINNKTLLRSVYISDLRDAYQERMQYFGDAPVTYIGFPTSENGGNGGVLTFNSTLAISANTAYPDQCWQFFESMLTEDYQESLSWSFPLSREAFDKKATEEMKPQTYKDENGEIVDVPFTVYRGSEEVKYPDMPQSFVDELKAYIENTTTGNYYDETILNIGEEEAGMYFSGDQTAQAAADMIQSRVSIYLSEQS